MHTPSLWQSTPCPSDLYSSGRVFGKEHFVQFRESFGKAYPVPLNCTVQGELWQSAPCPFVLEARTPSCFQVLDPDLGDS